MSAAGLTVAMIVRDEESNLRELLPGLVDVADDVVIVDTGSSDGSVNLARSRGARVFAAPWEDDFAKARNRGLEEVRTSHVLWLDADDRIDREALSSVRREALARPQTGLMLLLVNESADPNAVSSCWQLRVFPSRPEHRFEGRIHEQILPGLAATGTPVEKLDVTVRHTGYVDPGEVARKSRRNFEMLRREIAGGRENDVSVLLHYVKAATMCGEIEEALATARRCVESPPPETPAEIIQSAAVTWARIEYGRRRADEALRILGEAVERVPDDPIVRFFRADALRRSGDLTGALRDLEVARAAPVRCTLLPLPVAGLGRAIRLEMGELQEIFCRPADAAALYREILDDQPEDRAARRALARALIGAFALREAREVLDGLEDRHEDAGEVCLLRATLAFQEGRDAEADALYERALALHPGAWAASLHRGHIALRGGRLDEARRHYERALSVADNPETRVGLAASLLEGGRLTECLDHLAEAVGACVGRPLPRGTEALSGEALYRIGRYMEAVGAFENHLKRWGAEARIVKRLADCYRNLEAPAAARLGYEEALRLDPGLVEASEGLQALETVH
jgi:tetratricopeptide (TPR) repeat protein